MNMFKPSGAKSPTEYLAMLDEPRRGELKQLDALIRASAPGLKRQLCAGMLGYGPYRYRYASGREGDWCVVALASQKQYISLYVCIATGAQYLAERHKARLPKASIGKSCIRFKRLADVDLDVLREIVAEAEALLPRMLDEMAAQAKKRTAKAATPARQALAKSSAPRKKVASKPRRDKQPGKATRR